jgi:hypothetical protein
MFQNFFSTQLIHVDDQGRISIISQSWWFVVVALPLTIATFAAWKLWLSYTMKAHEGKKTPQFVESKASERRSEHGFTWLPWARFSSKRHHRRGILENEPRKTFGTDPRVDTSGHNLFNEEKMFREW